MIAPIIKFPVTRVIAVVSVNFALGADIEIRVLKLCPSNILTVAIIIITKNKGSEITVVQAKPLNPKITESVTNNPVIVATTPKGQC